MEIEGKIILDLPEEGGTSKAGNLWRKKSWVLETFGQYPRKVKFDLFGDRIDQVRLEAGKSYKVSVDAESREFNGRWYTDLRAYAAQEMGAPPDAAGSRAAIRLCLCCSRRSRRPVCCCSCSRRRSFRIRRHRRPPILTASSPSG